MDNRNSKIDLNRKHKPNGDGLQSKGNGEIDLIQK